MSLQAKFSQVQDCVASQVLGQELLIERMLICLICEGHLLVEGMPGLAKTRAINVLSKHIEGSFKRVQFTPDLLPADLTGTDVFRPQTGKFEFQSGPLFENLILADEINRAPAKVQSALLEAMAEFQITVGQHSYPLPRPFMVMATQNPIDQDGTYALPEAQLDRFMLHVSVAYPDYAREREILRLVREERIQGTTLRGADKSPLAVLSRADLAAAQLAVLHLHMASSVEEYIVRLVTATRGDQALDGYLETGASPRATLALDMAARSVAWLQGRDHVTPQDVQCVAPDVLRHRLRPSLQAEVEGVDADALIDMLLQHVAAV